MADQVSAADREAIWPDREEQRRIARRDALWSAQVGWSSVACGEDGMHAGRPHGCPDDGSGCLCECHDENAETWRPAPTSPVEEGTRYDVIEQAARTIYEGFFANQPVRYVPWNEAEEAIKDNNRLRACALYDAGLLSTPTPAGVTKRVDFFEEDEPVEKIQAAFDAGSKCVSAAPAGERHSCEAVEVNLTAAKGQLRELVADRDAEIERWRAAHQAKTDDFARETLRTALMLAACERSSVPVGVVGQELVGYEWAQRDIRRAGLGSQSIPAHNPNCVCAHCAAAALSGPVPTDGEATVSDEARAVAAVERCLTGKGDVEPTRSREFYVYVAEMVTAALRGTPMLPGPVPTTRALLDELTSEAAHDGTADAVDEFPASTRESDDTEGEGN